MAITIERAGSAAFTRRSALMWLLGANALMFVVLRLIAVAGVFAGSDAAADAAVSAVSLPPAPAEILSAPWTPVTYMFSHYDPSHLMFNLLWLAWAGITAWQVMGNGRLIAAYAAGGIGGATAFLLYGYFSPGAESGLLGASAAVIAVAVAVTVIEPNRYIDLMFLRPLKLKWVTLIMLGVTLIFFSGYNGGSDAAHAGGAAAGLVFGYICARLSRRKAENFVPRPAVTGSASELSDEEKLDELLDKIKRSGYESLSHIERITLFNLSKKLKR